MQYLLLQTFAWMCFAGLIGAILGCMARRFLGAGAQEGELAPVGTLARSAPGLAAPAPAPLAKTGPRPSAPAAPAPVAKGPMIEGANAPAPVGVSVPRPGAAVEAYPITTVGIPRGAPELVQPQIQTISLPPAAATIAAATATAAAAAASTVTKVAPVGASVAATVGAAKVQTSYPITTVGLPGYKAPPVAAAPVVAPARPADTARFEDALRGQAQPRPEPLRPELARPPSSQTPAAPTVKSTLSTPAEVPFTAVAASGAALAALAERAAAATTTPSAAKPVVPATVAPVAEKPVAAGTVTVPASVTPPQAAAPVKVEAAGATPVVKAPVGATGAPADDLTRIRTIDASMQTRLAGLGVTRFVDMAKWSPADVARISQATGMIGRIEQENWIEQAQILATGGETEYSRRRSRGDVVAPAAPAPAAPVSVVASVPSSPVSALPSAAAAAAAAAMAAATTARASASNSTIGSPAARLSDAIRDNADKASEQTGRVLRPDLAGLRSVRSEALRSEGGAGDQSRGPGGNRGMGANEDLKRIRGIGVLIEKKLNSLGVNAYEQVANWTSADIDRVSQILDFKGRIERENWVEQARILASGGQTEFSRRVDRGEA